MVRVFGVGLSAPGREINLCCKWDWSARPFDPQSSDLTNRPPSTQLRRRFTCTFVSFGEDIQSSVLHGQPIKISLSAIGSFLVNWQYQTYINKPTSSCNLLYVGTECSGLHNNYKLMITTNRGSKLVASTGESDHTLCCQGTLLLTGQWEYLLLHK